jgi:hypothetical protein
MSWNTVFKIDTKEHEHQRHVTKRKFNLQEMKKISHEDNRKNDTE